MRLPQPRRALSTSLALALLSLPLFAAPYSSTSPQELQRRLEQDTNRLVDSLRNQRNTPSRSGGSSGPSPWELEVRARQQQRERDAEARSESARLDAEWRRDHPYETRQQYNDRQAREASERIRELAEENAAHQARAAAAAKEAAERRVREDWAYHRTRRHGYAAEIEPPRFPTAPDALAWYLAHANATGNRWAATQAAFLLTEGWRVPQDLPKAIALIDPRSPHAKKDGGPHLETRTLYAYLQLTSPDAFAGTGLTPDSAAARTELERIAPNYDFAKWYLARVLAESPEPADQQRSLLLAVPGYSWMRSDYSSYVADTAQGRAPLLNQLSGVIETIIQKHAAHFPHALAQLSFKDFEYLASALPKKPKELHDQLVLLYAEAVAVRAVPKTLNGIFGYSSYERVLPEAAALGSDAPHGLATLRRYGLLQGWIVDSFQPAWGKLNDTPRIISSLSRWAADDGILGARARLALSYLADELASSQTWTAPQLPEMVVWKKATATYLASRNADSRNGRPGPSPATYEADGAETEARDATMKAIPLRDAAAPRIDALPALLAAIERSLAWQRSVQQLATFARATSATSASDTPAFATEHASFDLAKAAALFDAALAPNTSAASRRQQLFEATRLGDAFAPILLAAELRSEIPGLQPKLTALSNARRTRDEAALNPRALAARVLDDRFNNQDPEPMLSAAVAAGSTLAARLQLAARIDKVMSRESGLPTSTGVAPELIAEFDAAVAKIADDQNYLNEWTFLTAILPAEKSAAQIGEWYWPIALWKTDRVTRLNDADLLSSFRPEAEAIIATLSQWPGLNQDDPRNEAWVNQSIADFKAAEKLIETDGIGALKLFLQAAGRGNRGALELLAINIREGTGQLPRSPEFADLLMSAALKIVQADAEVGDAFAADYLGNCLLEGKNLPADPVAGTAWLHYAAERGKHASAVKLADLSGHGEDNPVDPAAARHWSAVAEIISYQELLPVPPRRLAADLTPVAPIRPQLEAALTAATRQLGQPHKPLTNAEDEAETNRHRDAFELAKTNPHAGLTALAGIAATGYKYANFSLAEILAGGRYGLEPDRALAQRFHAFGLAELQLEAEAGDRHAAYRLGLHALETSETRDPATALRWLAYSARRGEDFAALFLQRLYTSGAPGIPADPPAAKRWQAVASAIGRNDLLMAPPLRPTAPTLDLAPHRTKFEAALNKAAKSAKAKKFAFDKDAFATRFDAAFALSEADPAAALVALAGEGHSASAFELAAFFSAGELGPEGPYFPADAALAARFHAAARALQQADAERGDPIAVNNLAEHFLNPVDASPDFPAAIHWLTYGAERGNGGNAEELARLYTDGAPGLPADPAAAARWTAFAEKIRGENFKPRAPLR